MLKRPSSRRHSESKAQISLNLVPILDTMVTLIGFLLFSMSFLNLVSIDSPAPVTSPEEAAKTLLQKPLQLTLSINQKTTELWSPFERISTVSIAHLPDGKPDLKKIHEALIGLKSKFPSEHQIVFVPNYELSYDTLIALMDTTRLVEVGDPALFAVDAHSGNNVPVKELFPQIVFGNLMSAEEEKKL